MIPSQIHFFVQRLLTELLVKLIWTNARDVEFVGLRSIIKPKERTVESKKGRK